MVEAHNLLCSPSKSVIQSNHACAGLLRLPHQFVKYDDIAKDGFFINLMIEELLLKITLLMREKKLMARI
jgi:hypothetical protein